MFTNLRQSMEERFNRLNEILNKIENIKESTQTGKMELKNTDLDSVAKWKKSKIETVTSKQGTLKVSRKENEN